MNYVVLFYYYVFAYVVILGFLFLLFFSVCVFFFIIVSYMQFLIKRLGKKNRIVGNKIKITRCNPNIVG